MDRMTHKIFADSIQCNPSLTNQDFQVFIISLDTILANPGATTSDPQPGIQ